MGQNLREGHVVLPLWRYGLLVFLAAFSVVAMIVLAVFWVRAGDGMVFWEACLIALVAAVLLAVLEFVVYSRVDRRSMRMLREATEEVARGNYGVHIPERRLTRKKLVQAFNQMTDELNKVEMLRNDFINNVSHEFKTPTASIYGYAKVLADSGLDAQQKKLADVIVNESERLSKLTSSILRLSKLENINMTTNCETYSLDEQLRKVIVLLNKKAAAKNQKLIITLESIPYLGDRELLFQVWHNILDNAIKYTDEGKKISVSCKKEDADVVVCIRDSGIGMDEATQSRMFEKFYQGDTTHGGEGNGLGLAIVKRVVDLSGGRIIVQSTPGEGTAFIVRLPAIGALYRL